MAAPSTPAASTEPRARQPVEREPAPAELAIHLDDLSVRLSLQKEVVLSLRETVIRWLQRRPVEIEEFWPLRNVSFDVARGEAFGVVGRNGAGKSTLLKVIAGVLKQTRGVVDVRGRIAPLLELGAGFDSEMTGRENIYLYGSLLGFPRQKLDERFDHIVEFAEIEHFIDVPLKNYSSGMASRLGFAVATDVDPDILIVDEALTVGDARFQLKCMERIERFQKRGVTILFVSHNPDQVRRLCSRAIWLDNGDVRLLGSVDEVIDAYTAAEYEAPRRQVSWTLPDVPSYVADSADGAARANVSVAYRSPNTLRHMPPVHGEYDFIDFTLADARSMDFCRTVFGGRGLSVTNNPSVAERVRVEGGDAVSSDLFEIDFPDDSVSYVTLMDSLNLLPTLEAVSQVLSSAARWARDFIFIRMPSYEDEEYLRALGLKYFWHDWSWYPLHPRIDQIASILQALGLEQYHISHRDPAVSSDAPAIVPSSTAPDQGTYDPAEHGPKPSIEFPRPIYGQIDIFIALRRFETAEWHDIIKRGTQS